MCRRRGRRRGLGGELPDGTAPPHRPGKVQPALAPDGTLWVPDKEIDTIFRLDPTTGKLIDSFPGGNGAFQALRAFGSMWVTSYAGSKVWRFRTTG